MRRILMAAVLSLTPILSLAASASEQLEQFVTDVNAATGQFKQYTVGTQGETRPAQSGEFSFQRPGRFKWNVLKPYEQLVVSDGAEVFQYDPDLSQVTVRRVDQAIGASPAAILFGAGKLSDSFTVTDQPDRDGLQWLLAVPRNTDAGFSQVAIGMRDNTPVRIELLDTFDQKTHVELSNVKPVFSLPAKAFQFEPPADTDVVRM